ncbi:DNA photolyase phr1, partial [Coemansia erecta]
YVEESNSYGLVSISGNTVTKTEDYNNFKSALAAVSPTGYSLSNYTASGKQQSCPDVSTANSWQASGTLPPTPSNATCECMMKSLHCVSQITEIPTDTNDLATFGTNVSSIYGTVCGSISCSAVEADGKAGTYGKYSFCNTIQRVSWVMNAWYISQRGVSGSCDFSGFATLAKPSLSSDSSCSNATDSSSGDSGQHSELDSDSGSHKSGAESAMKSLSAGAVAVAVWAAIF